MTTETVAGIEYQKPKVILLNQSGIGSAEIAARTCYDSFSNSENTWIKDFPILVDNIHDNPPGHHSIINSINSTDQSGLLHDLAWTYHHHSILEHASLTYYIEGTSRGVLQEHSRHRLQAISVRSTRYTMSDIINTFLVSLKFDEHDEGLTYFRDNITKLNMFVTTNYFYNQTEIDSIYNKLVFQLNSLGLEKFFNLSIVPKNIEEFKTERDIIKAFEILNRKKKRNVGDSFKHIVTDNWKVDLVVTFNLRSLKNYFDLRDSGAAWFQIQWLAEEMKKATPKKYLKLIDKKFKND